MTTDTLISMRSTRTYFLGSSLPFLPSFTPEQLPPNLQLTSYPINSLSAAQSAETLKEHGITHIISVTSRPPSIPEELHIKHKYFEIQDDHKADLLAVLPEAVLRLEWILKNGDGGLDGKGGRSKVLVHCCMGKSRSGAVVVGYGLSLLFCVDVIWRERRR